MKTGFMKTGLLILLMLSAAPWAADDYAQWLYYRNITINTTGAGVGNLVTKFPVLVRLSTSDSLIFRASRNKGPDVRFAKSNGVHLPYQIERWDSTNKAAELWVLVDSIKGNDSSQYIRMYWGNPAAVDSQKAASVFSASNNFTGVWHLTEESTGKGSGGPGLYKDATGVNNGDDSVANASASGIIGLGHAFTTGETNAGDYIAMRTPVMSLTANPFTVSCWVNIPSGQTYGGAIMTKGDGGWNSGATCFYFGDSTNKINVNGLFPQAVSHSNNFLISSNPMPTGAWHYVAFTHDTAQNGGKGHIYIDGVAQTLAMDSLRSSTADATSYLPKIGDGNGNEMQRTFNGSMDEFEMANVLRSDDWIKLSYKNQLFTGTGDSLTSPGGIGVQPPGNLTYTKNPVTVVSLAAMTPDTAKWTGKVDSFTVYPALPKGLSLNTNNGIISGAPTDTSAQKDYIITATNGVGSTKDTVSITVNAAVVLPSISVQPVNTWAGVNSATAKLWLKASGSAPLSYQWTKNGAAIATGIKDTLNIDTVKRTDNLTVYQCKVTNPGGSVSSAPCTLHVVAAIFGAKPMSGNDTLTVVFTDSSIGNSAAAPLKWKWSFGDGSADTVGATKHFYSKPNTYTAKLIVTANGVADSMKKAITVNALPLLAGFKPDTTAGPDSLAVNFTDTSKGTIHDRLWRFGDGDSLPDANTRRAVTHTYRKTGCFTPSLTVNGPAGTNTAKLSDCILIYNPDSAHNPIQLSGKYVSATSVSVTFSSYSSLHDAAPAPYVDKIELWGRKNVLPADTITAAKLNTYALATLKAAGVNYTAAVTLPGPYLPTDSAGFMAVILWNTGTRSAFSGRNGTYVPMRDTVKPDNNLVISGAYVADSTMNIFLNNVSTLDSLKTPSVVMEYDFSDSINFTSSIKKTIAAGAVVRGAVDNRYTYAVFDPRFSGVARQVYCAVSLIGANTVASVRNKTTVTVGTPRPDNPLALKAQTLSANWILLQWRHWRPVADADSMRIWYSNKMPVPIGRDVMGPDFKSLSVPLMSTEDTIKIFEANTLYYFGAEVAYRGIWSFVTDSSSDSAKTLKSSDTTMIPNTIVVDTAFFDSALYQIKVVFTVDTAGHFSDALDAKITWTATNMPGVETAPPWQSSLRSAIKPLDTIIIDLKDSIQFNTRYYFGLWLRKQNAPWSPPTDSSKGSLVTPPFYAQAVRYGKDFPVVYADNKILRICTDTGTAKPITNDDNTVKRSTALPPVGQGFIALSIGFEFTSKLIPPQLNIGIKFNAPPAPYSGYDVRMYRYDMDKGLWWVDRSPFIYDNVNGYVSVFTRNIEAPFIAMIDTMHPKVIPLDSIKDFAPASLDVNDSFSISDNIKNVSWKFQCAKGADAYDPSAQVSDTFSTYSGAAATLIEAGLVSADEGVRAILVVDDGVHYDTVNVSRRVIRDTSDVTQTIPMKWVPLRVTAFPDKPKASDALSALASKGVWKYDITQCRLFRWYSYAGNAGKPDTSKWVEYADSTDSLFSFVPGHVIWIKTRKSVTIDFGKSVTPDLTRPDTITLQAKAWSDIALPYHFNVKLGDIIDATADTLHTFDSLHIIAWKRDKDTNAIHHDDIFYPFIGIAGPETTMVFQQSPSQNACYSVYNYSASPFKVVIPPLPVAMSKYTNVVHAKHSGAVPWVFKISGWTNSEGALSSVYCAFKEGKPDRRYYPAAPSLEENTAIRFCDDKNNQFGYAMQTGAVEKDGGTAFAMALHNASNNAERIRYRVTALSGLPRNMRIVVVNPETGALENASDSLAVTAEAGGSVSRQLVIGTDAYIANVKSSLLSVRCALIGVYPNPFKRSMRIRFTIPASGLREVKLGIFNPSGREIWNASVACAGLSGPREFVWNGKSKNSGAFAAGMYIVRMAAVNVNGKPAGVFEKKIMYLP